MSCKICGKTSCTTSFHSVIEQEIFDGVEERVKSRIRSLLKSKTKWLSGEDMDTLVVEWEDIENILE